MCLSTVNLTKRGKSNKIVSRGGRFTGYKAFEVEKAYNNKTGDYDGKEIISSGLIGKMPKIGQWIKSDNSIIEDIYTSGFHIFTDLTDVQDYGSNNFSDYVVFKVEFEDIVGIGKQSDGDYGITLIAKRMKLLKRI